MSPAQLSFKCQCSIIGCEAGKWYVYVYIYIHVCVCVCVCVYVYTPVVSDEPKKPGPAVTLGTCDSQGLLPSPSGQHELMLGLLVLSQRNLVFDI